MALSVARCVGPPGHCGNDFGLLWLPCRGPGYFLFSMVERLGDSEIAVG